MHLITLSFKDALNVIRVVNEGKRWHLNIGFNGV